MVAWLHARWRALLAFLRGRTPFANPDPQDPLPEASWFWRRLLVFGLAVGLYRLIGFAVTHAHQNDLPGMAAHLMILLGVILVLYLIAPSANQLAELLASLKFQLRGPPAAAPTRPAQPPAPPPVPEPEPVPPPTSSPDPSTLPPWERPQ